MMQPERWQQLSRIFKSVIELDPDKRSAFIEAECGADQSLRHEVELLIESHQKAQSESFIEAPAVERAAPMLQLNDAEAEEPPDQLEEGQLVDRYLVVHKLGAGGMGEVYLARDTRLDRTVALKILPGDVASDKRRMQRFKQEAKIASTLNQPNIMTVFEFGEAGSLHFIATEHIDGETLRRRLRDRALKLTEILDISIQILAALDAAHEARIAHRDIKPDNIMIRRRDHIVKVLDFGLAKLTETSTTQSSDPEAATEMLVRTKPGSIMGTVSYMSPEQAQGLPVDERTDIWSTGVVIYEMVVGRVPFGGATSSHTVVEILEKEPALLARLAPFTVPPELERIVGKALAKDVGDRYQTAKDMLIDLRNLRRRLDVDLEIGRSAAPEAFSTAATKNENVTAKATADSMPALTQKSESARPQRKSLVLIVSMVAIATVAALLLGTAAWRYSHSNPVASAPATAPLPERQLNYWMMVQKYRSDKPYEKPFRLDREINFEKDYRVSLNVHSPQAGFLYILNEGPTTTETAAPSFVVLFPSPTANGGSSFLAENKPVQIPQQGGFRFDQEEGTEKLWLIFSASAIPELEAVKGFANRKDLGAINDPVLAKSVKEFLKAHSATKPTLEKNEALKETTVKIPGELLVQEMSLEHH